MENPPEDQNLEQDLYCCYYCRNTGVDAGRQLVTSPNAPNRWTEVSGLRIAFISIAISSTVENAR